MNLRRVPALVFLLVAVAGFATAIGANDQHQLALPIVWNGGTVSPTPTNSPTSTNTPEPTDTPTPTNTATSTPPPTSNVIYVKHDAAGSTDGSSWADAYTDLQDALGIAEAGDEIWVAQGVYYPADDALDRTATFLFRDGVELYGGFAGTETECEQRDWEANVTVLSGDLDRNDTTNENGVVTTAEGINGTNAYHVLWLDGTIDPITNATEINGFTITAGQADGVGDHQDGGGLYCDAYDGKSSPTLANVTFTGNDANYGGAIYNCGRNGGTSSPTLINVTFSGNRAHGDYYGGGAMFNNGYNGTSSPTLINVIFSGNSASDKGGAMCNWGAGGTSSPLLTNVAFSGNQADAGGAMFNAGYNGESFPALTNVTFSGNWASSGGAVYNWGGGDGTSSPTLANCILWGNEASEGAQIYDDNANSSVSYSDIEGGYSGNGNIDADPLFADPVSADQAPTAAGDYRLQTGSPAINAGDNEAVGVDTDLDGNPRIVNGVVDIGAYEFQVL